MWVLLIIIAVAFFYWHHILMHPDHPELRITLPMDKRDFKRRTTRTCHRPVRTHASSRPWISGRPRLPCPTKTARAAFQVSGTVWQKPSDQGAHEQANSGAGSKVKTKPASKWFQNFIAPPFEN